LCIWLYPSPADCHSATIPCRPYRALTDFFEFLQQLTSYCQFASPGCAVCEKGPLPDGSRLLIVFLMSLHSGPPYAVGSRCQMTFPLADTYGVLPTSVEAPLFHLQKYPHETVPPALRSFPSPLLGHWEEFFCSASPLHRTWVVKHLSPPPIFQCALPSDRVGCCFHLPSFGASSSGNRLFFF